MTLTAADHADIGMLIGFALQPTVRPASRSDYRRVMTRYRSELEFHDAAEAILLGLNAHVLSDGDFGLVLGVDPDSAFAFRYADLPYTAKREHRLVFGLITVALAAYAYPTPADLDDDRVRRIVENEFEAWLRDACEHLRVRDAAGEPIPDDGLDEAWRVYTSMPQIMIGERGRGARRLTNSCTLYWVQTCLKWMADQGLARADSSSSEGAWTVTERFRAHVRDMAAHNAYAALSSFTRTGEATIPATEAAQQESA